MKINQSLIYQIVHGVAGQVRVKEKPAVYISGGIDSCIVLHHLRQQFKGEIKTFTAIFGNQVDKTERVVEIVERYGTDHYFIYIEDFVDTLRYCMARLPFKEPRYNIWPFYLADQAEQRGCKNVYIGEGSDEIFGGYPDKDFLTGWASQLIYVKPTFDVIHAHFDLNLHAPFSQLNWRYFYGNAYRPPDKLALRLAYKGIVPDCVVSAPATPPAFTNYFETWRKELRDYVEFEKPESELTVQDIKDSLQLLATDAWVKARGMRLKK